MPMPLLLPSSTCSFSLLILLTNLANLLLLNPQAHSAAWELELTSSRRLRDTVAGKQKSNIFRANKPAATSSSAEADQQPYFPTEAEFGSGSQRQLGEKGQQRQQQLEQQREEVRFLRDEPAAAEEDGQQTKKQNPFEQTRFDANFPVHNLCGPWNSGRQASDLEWAEPADKLLKLLNTGKHKYNLFMAPGQMTGHATNVSIAMYIESMSSFKAQTMDFEVDMYFAMGWYDRRLAHNCTHPLLITHRPLAERVWTPDLYFLNAKFAYLQEVTTPNFMLIVYPDGLIFKTLRIDVTLSCNMDLQLFPFDKQECPLVIQSFAYIESMLNLSWHVDPPFYPIATNPELKLNDMAITGMRFERCSSPYTMFRGTGVWSCLRGYIVMKRLVLFHLIQTYIPSAMLVSISWMTFWLDPRASPARISLTITSLLTLTTMSNGARQDLPQVSYIKAMDIWQNFSQALIFLVLLEYSFVSYYFTRRTYQCRCSMRRNGAAEKRAGWAQKQQQPMFRNATTEDVRLGPASRTSMNNLLTNNVSNNTNGAGRCGITPNHLSCPEGIDSNSNSLRRRRHSAELDQQQQQQPTSAILATAPQLHKNRSKRGRVGRLCVRESVEFEWTGGGMANGSDRPQHWETEDEEAENEGRRQYTDRPCQKCQQLDQRRARAIDRYSRVLFPGIFVTFCALYWLYYWRIMASNTEEQAV